MNEPKYTMFNALVFLLAVIGTISLLAAGVFAFQALVAADAAALYETARTEQTNDVILCLSAFFSSVVTFGIAGCVRLGVKSNEKIDRLLPRAEDATDERKIFATAG